MLAIPSTMAKKKVEMIKGHQEPCLGTRTVVLIQVPLLIQSLSSKDLFETPSPLHLFLLALPRYVGQQALLLTSHQKASRGQRYPCPASLMW